MILDEREACVTLPYITVLKTRIEQLNGGEELIRVFVIGRGERDYFRSEGVILAPNFSLIMLFWNPVLNQSSKNGKNLYDIWDHSSKHIQFLTKKIRNAYPNSDHRTKYTQFLVKIGKIYTLPNVFKS